MKPYRSRYYGIVVAAVQNDDGTWTVLGSFNVTRFYSNAQFEADYDPVGTVFDLHGDGKHGAY